MKKKSDMPVSGRLWTVLRWGGIALSGAPVLLMLATGIAGSAASGQLRMDIFLPAELFLLTFPGMILLAFAAVKQGIYARLSAALPVTAAAALLLCQGLAILKRIASGLREAEGPLTAALVGLLLLFDLAAAAAPVVGLLSVRRLRRMTSENREGPP